MIYEYPDWVETFQCIADRCPDTCCAGWEVGVDRDTCELYRKAPEPLASRFRQVMRTDPETGGCYFLPAEKMRCPFLNERNLCDIIIHLGPDALSMVCDEYPRYFNEIGDYQQMDMSLSCMEFGRIFFSHGDMVLKRQEDDLAGETEADNERLLAVLDLRDEMIGRMQASERPWKETLMALEREYGQEPERLFSETDDHLCRLMNAQEMLDARTAQVFGEVGRSVSAHGQGESSPEEEGWFRKLAVYFIFRYMPDLYRDTDTDAEFRLINRSLRFLELMCDARRQKEHRELTVEDIIDIAHLYSRQVEHSSEIVERLKKE